jgi:hypothetical protein
MVILATDFSSHRLPFQEYDTYKHSVKSYILYNNNCVPGKNLLHLIKEKV